MEEVLGQRDQAITAMRSYQEQCDGLRGEIAAQEHNISALKDQVNQQASLVLFNYRAYTGATSKVNKSWRDY